MLLILEIEDVTEIDTVLLNTLHAVHNNDSFFVKAKNKMKEDGIYADDEVLIINEMPSDTCGKCGCTEYLCGHNKR
ncbi:hypothetical protein [Kangiella sp.]|uniref:hypothetical protein n=1 Tax=Kangiella sp. TaxID=1920245 RepID=UPI003A93DA3B